MGQLDQKVAVVTGADSGIGRAIASDAASYITGTTYVIDGGLTVNTGGL